MKVVSIEQEFEYLDQSKNQRISLRYSDLNVMSTVLHQEQAQISADCLFLEQFINFKFASI